MYRIKEIFGPTVQGEGSRAGTPVLFVRFAGCNRWNGLEKYRSNSICSYCDTDFFGGEKLTAQEVIAQLKRLSPEIKSVVITGGEPTIQLDEPFCKAMTDAGYHMFLETNGSNALGKLADYFRHVTMSPKQAREETKLEECDDLKLLYPFIGSGIDWDAFKTFPHVDSFLQPVWEHGGTMDDNLKLALEFIYKIPQIKLSLQTHKIIGVK